MAKKSSEKNNVMGYFRKIYEQRDDLLKSRNNDEIKAMYLADHPHEKEIPKNVLSTLANTKSSLKNKKRKGGKKRGPKPRGTQPVAIVKKDKPSSNFLDRIEIAIDDIMVELKNVESMAEVVHYLRRARNITVMMAGE